MNKPRLTGKLTENATLPLQEFADAAGVIFHETAEALNNGQRNE